MASVLLHKDRHDFVSAPGKIHHSMSTMDHNFSVPPSRALSSKANEREASFVDGATAPENDGAGSQFLPGGCAAMRSVEQVMRELAAGDAPVLIRAEAGAGKRTAAQRIHEMSIRRSQPFVALFEAICFLIISPTAWVGILNVNTVPTESFECS